MGKVRTYYCWRCCGANRVPVGACASCGLPIEKPPETSYVEQLIWPPQPLKRLVSIAGVDGTGTSSNR